MIQVLEYMLPCFVRTFSVNKELLNSQSCFSPLIPVFYFESLNVSLGSYAESYVKDI